MFKAEAIDSVVQISSRMPWIMSCQSFEECYRTSFFPCSNSKCKAKVHFGDCVHVSLLIMLKVRQKAVDKAFL